MKLANYVYFPKFFSEEECNEIEKEGKKNLKKATVRESYGKSLRDTNIAFINEYSSVRNLLEKIVNQMVFAGNEYYECQLKKFEQVQYAEYKKDMFYRWHTDAVNNPEDPLRRDLSASLILNRKHEYTGGSLQVIQPDCISIDNVLTPRDIEDQEQGTLIVFPSSMIHQVTKVTSGIRKSLVIWSSAGGLF